MKKKSLFLSASLTAFLLVLIAGVVKVGADTYNRLTSNSVPPVSQAVQATQADVVLPATVAPTETAAPTATTSPYISPEEAVALAAARLGSTDLYSVETTKFGGMDVYKVTFSSGYLVYVSPEGHIMYVSSLTQVVQQSSGQQGSSSNSNSSGGGQSSGGTGSHGGDDGGGGGSGGDD
jgi:uncharacterized membrane protein YgcG